MYGYVSTSAMHTETVCAKTMLAMFDSHSRLSVTMTLFVFIETFACNDSEAKHIGNLVCVSPIATEGRWGYVGRVHDTSSLNFLFGN